MRQEQPKKADGATTVGGVTFVLHPGLLATHRATERRHVDELRKALAGFVDLPADAIARVPFGVLRDAVCGYVQEKWYDYAGKPYPIRVHRAQTLRVNAAIHAARGYVAGADAPVIDLMAALKDALAKKTPGKTAAVRELIAAGRSDEEILAILRPTHPTLIPATIRYARNHPRRKDI